MPSYPLAPGTRIAAITRSACAAIEAAAAGSGKGPVVLTGHSAGGHLVARQVCTDSGLKPATLARIRRTVPISGLHDLRPLLATRMNDTLKLDIAEAHAESPALARPLPGVRVIAWVGAAERPEFVRQNALLANIWAGLGADTSEVAVADRHHLDVIEALADPGSDLVEALLGE
jgi:acetyl esterase/lipase